MTAIMSDKVIAVVREGFQVLEAIDGSFFLSDHLRGGGEVSEEGSVSGIRREGPSIRRVMQWC